MDRRKPAEVPVPDVWISIDHTQSRTRTDKKGRYRLELAASEIPTLQPSTIRAERIGYRPSHQEVDLVPGKLIFNLDFELFVDP